MNIRTATLEDAPMLLEIYRPYVEQTAITFEYVTPTIADFQKRMADTLRAYPYLVAEDEAGALQGYAYAAPFKARPAYQWAVETSIYVRQGQHGKGYGRALLLALEERLKKQHILNANACIAYTEAEDETLTNDSMRFHEKMGYRLVGRFHQCGYKFQRWYDMIWMEKHLGEHNEKPAPIGKPILDG